MGPSDDKWPHQCKHVSGWDQLGGEQDLLQPHPVPPMASSRAINCRIREYAICQMA